MRNVILERTVAEKERKDEPRPPHITLET